MFVYPNNVENRLFGSSRGLVSVCLFGICVVIALSGCGGDQPRDADESDSYTERSSAVFAPDPKTQPGENLTQAQIEEGSASKGRGMDSGGKPVVNGVPLSDRGGRWSIVLANAGRGGKQRANEMLRVIQEDAGLDEAYIDTRSSGLVIVYGDYLGVDDPKAMRDLKRIRQIELGGAKPFERVLISPPSSEQLRGSNPNFDLRTAKAKYGEKAIYTLQVGLYGRADYQMPSEEDLLEFRLAAETAVRELRADGVIAFYYHAPARSMVTVGVFGERDFNPTTLPPMQSNELRKMREQFPNNLLNGQGINERVRTESGFVTRLQSSQLVSIPEK